MNMFVALIRSNFDLLFKASMIIVSDLDEKNRIKKGKIFKKNVKPNSGKVNEGDPLLPPPRKKIHIFGWKNNGSDEIKIALFFLKWIRAMKKTSQKA